MMSILHFDVKGWRSVFMKHRSALEANGPASEHGTEGCGSENLDKGNMSTPLAVSSVAVALLGLSLADAPVAWPQSRGTRQQPLEATAAIRGRVIAVDRVAQRRYAISLRLT